jgi:hypothetical protein
MGDGREWGRSSETGAARLAPGERYFVEEVGSAHGRSCMEAIELVCNG